jgi:hypothetical protein
MFNCCLNVEYYSNVETHLNIELFFDCLKKVLRRNDRFEGRFRKFELESDGTDFMKKSQSFLNLIVVTY